MARIEVVEATQAKNAFGKVTDRARVADVAIRRHGQIQAYIISPERYRHFEAVAGVEPSALAQLEAEYDELVERMQSPKHRAAVDKLFSTPMSKIRATAKAATAAGKKGGARPATRRARAAAAHGRA